MNTRKKGDDAHHHIKNVVAELRINNRRLKRFITLFFALGILKIKIYKIIYYLITVPFFKFLSRGTTVISGSSHLPAGRQGNKIIPCEFYP